jgi:hypothetical protein
MRIAELFRRDIYRTIEEVVKVDLADDAVIANELDEYVATDHILDEFEKVLDPYQESINSPNESCTIWVSGFFGSGKSSWAKVLGYLLWNPVVADTPAVDRFFERTSAPRLRALLNTVHAQAPTLAVLLNLATGSNVVAREGESVVLPVYRALLERLGYSRNLLLAELEFTLEDDGRLQEFQDLFVEATGKNWAERRFTSLAKNEASRALHLLDPDTFPQPDSWAKAATEPEIDADWFVARALALLERRGGGASRLMFVVDEAGQYVARSVQRMLDLQGLAEACQKKMGSIWLTVTSQERLNDVIDSLESKQVELARAQARFPLRVDLLPSDIDEVTGKRVLDKTDAGQQAVRAAVGPHRHQLATNTRLASPTRATEPGENELVRLYPLLPYQIQLLIDAVSARRTQGGASPVIGGSNRTLIKHAQQLITHPKHGLGSENVGALVTLDRSYDLLEELIPTSWRSEVDQVAERYGADKIDAKVMKVIALCMDVPALPLTAANIAALLHPDVDAESGREDVTAALARLVGDDRLRETDDGYKLQSPEQKDWEQARRAIDLTQGPSVRLRRLLLKQDFTGLSVARGRTFKVDVTVDGENVIAGDLPLHIEEADQARRDDLRAASRERANENRITWTYALSPDTWNALVELHRSRTMIDRRDTANKTPAEVELLGEERERERRNDATALQRLGRDLAAGQAIFRGRVDDVDGADPRSTAQRLIADRIEEVYPQLEQFTANLRRGDVLHLLRTPDLGTINESLRDDGIGLVRVSPTGYELVTDVGPLAALVAEIRTRASYGQEPTGGYLERHFADPPYGASVELVQVLCAAAVRAGLIEAIHQGQPIRNPSDARLDQVFTTLPRFRATGFRPPAGTDVSLERRVELAQRLEHIGHRPPGHSTDVLAIAVREVFLLGQEPTIRVESILNGLGIVPPEVITRTRALLERVAGDDNVDVVTTAHDTWADLVAGRTAVTHLDGLLQTSLDDLRMAQRESRRSPNDLTDVLAAEHGELRDLLAAGDLTDHAARIIAIGRRLADTRRAATVGAAEQLHHAIDELRAILRERYSNVDEAALAEALRPIEALAPPDDLTGIDAATLEAELDSARARAATAARQLEELRAAGRLAWVDVSDFVTEAITEEAEIDAVLERIREAIADHLADGKQVRLR